MKYTDKTLEDFLTVLGNPPKCSEIEFMLKVKNEYAEEGIEECVKIFGYDPYLTFGCEYGIPLGKDPKEHETVCHFICLYLRETINHIDCVREPERKNVYVANGVIERILNNSFAVATQILYGQLNFVKCLEEVEKREAIKSNRIIGVRHMNPERIPQIYRRALELFETHKTSKQECCSKLMEEFGIAKYSTALTYLNNAIREKALT